MCDYCSWIEQILARINVEAKLLQESIPPPHVDPTIIVHGGAGRIPKKKQKLMLEAVKNAALEAYKTLINGYTAVDAIEIAISRMENTLYLNYTKEAPLHTNDEIVWDAGIMTNNLDAGSIGLIHGIEHPIKLARQVLENTDHVLIVENGAAKLAKEADLPILMRKFIPTDSVLFIGEMEGEHYDTSSSTDSNDDFPIKCANDIEHKENDTSIIKMYFPECNFLEMEDIDTNDENEESEKLDEILLFHEARTVGAVAYDRKKRLSSGISTMEETIKMMGSISAIGAVIGCGIYADENGCCSLSGNDQTIYKYAPARKIVRRFNSKTTMMLEINDELEKFQKETGESQIGVIALNNKGEPSISFKSLHFPWACCRNGYIYYGCNKCDKFLEEITDLDRPLDCMCEVSK
ncbi:isoaspartyl peptidase/L-asparaginase-like [Vespula squamosa]|uniref:Isoaspartyl peptidase/L-asparaginase-like n=1 Tax=Vespula squamosa TaxID=30214 RepID=A0ABD2BDP3_VESSQ